jgi:pimeloyl-ACP methyl ester carboxylesterase
MELQPYEDLRPIAPGLHCMDGRWKKSPFKRRMTVLGHSSGALAIHSAIRLRDEDYATVLDPLGRVELILVPSSLHGDEARYYAERYSQARVLVPAPVREKCAAKLPRVDGTIAESWPPSWAAELKPLQVEGTRMGEAVFLHVPSRTLVVTDLVLHFTDELSGFARSMMRWNGALGRVGPTRIFRWYFLTDRDAFARSLQALRDWDFDRIVMSHGTIVEHDGKRRLLEGFAQFL